MIPIVLELNWCVSRVAIVACFLIVETWPILNNQDYVIKNSESRKRGGKIEVVRLREIAVFFLIVVNY